MGLSKAMAKRKIKWIRWPPNRAKPSRPWYGVELLGWIRR